MAEVLHGNANGDLLNARNDKTQVYGLQGNDTLTSDNKSDVLLVGGSGDDSLIISGGNGTLSGGAGNDTFELTYSADKKLSTIIEDVDPASDKIIVNFDGDTAPQLSSVKSGNNVVLRDNTSNFNVTLKGVRENDYFDGETINEVWNVLWLTNTEREKKNLPALTLSEGLMTGAATRVQEINGLAQIGVLNDHTRPNGKSYKTVLVDENLSLEQKYSRYGENLDGGAQVPVWVMNDWMNSKSHKDNILSKNFSKLGVGYLEDDPDPSNHRWYWTQEFAGSLKSPETVSTAELLTVNPQVNIVSNFIAGTDDADTINNGNNGATIEALGGDDSITNSGLLVSISGGNDNDTITSSGSFVTVYGGIGDDRISLSADSKGNVIEYIASDGNDTVYGFNDTDTLKIYNADYQYVYSTDGNDFVVESDASSIRLVDAAKFFINFHTTKVKYIVGSTNADSIENLYDSEVIIYANNGNDFIKNYNANVLISGDSGNDSIYNDAASVEVYGGNDSDTVRNFGSEVTIDGGEGNDEIRNDLTGVSVSIDGGSDNDDIFNFSKEVTIDGGEGNDKIYSEGNSVSIDGDIGNDDIFNVFGTDVTIFGGDGNDSIRSDGDSVTIDSGSGDDTISNHGAKVTIQSGAGNDSIHNEGTAVSIDGGSGFYDYIYNFGADVTILGGGGIDIIYNHLTGVSVNIDGGIGYDFIDNYGTSVTINGGAGNDEITNEYGASATIDGGAGNDSIFNLGSNVTIFGGNGNDSIHNDLTGVSVSIDSGTGDDTISNLGTDVTINAGTGNDQIYFGYKTKNVLLKYAAGDGSDTISCFNESDTLSISGGEYNPVTINNDIVLEVGTDSIWLLNAVGLQSVNVKGKKSEKSKLITLTENNDTLKNYELGATIKALGGDDTIHNESSYVTVEGGKGNDSIYNHDGDNVSIATGAGDDTIINDYSWYVKINGGAGDDHISLSSNSRYNAIQYSAGDGNDTVCGFNESHWLFIESDEYIPRTVGNDIVIAVGTDSITLVDTATLSSVKIITTYNNTIDGATIQATDKGDSINNFGSNVSIEGGAGNDTIANGNINSLGGSNVTITGGKGEDRIYNWYVNSVTMNGGDGNDYIQSKGDSVTVEVGEGDDSILNEGDSASLYGGDGNDWIQNSGMNSTLNGGKDNDSIDNFSTDVTILSGDGNDSIHNQESVVSIDSGSGDDTIVNLGSDVTINTGTGNDSIGINPTGVSVSIDSGSGDDTVGNDAAGATINTGAGNDSIGINPTGVSVSIDSGSGDDTVGNHGSDVTIIGGAGNDSIWNNSAGVSVSIDSGSGKDTIANFGADVTILGGAGNDSIVNNPTGVSVSIDSGSGNDYIVNFGVDATIISNDGNDSIHNEGDSVTIESGSGDDSIVNLGSDVTINAGIGDDYVYIREDAKNNLILYTPGDGNDTIQGSNETYTLKILTDDASIVSSINSGNDVIYTVGENTILLKGGRDNPPHVIIGESGTSGGGSSSGSGGSGGGGSSSGSGGGGRGGNNGGNTSGGTSANEGRGSDASGGRSAVGSAGRGTSTNTDTGGGTVRVTTSRSGGSRIAAANSTEIANFMNALTPATQPTTQLTANQRVYSGGNQIISDYVSGEKIIFGAAYTGSFYDGAGNYCVGSSTGALVIQNAVDKVVDLKDAAGNDFVKAYSATTAGVIDGRSIAGFEIINGSAGSDSIFAGDGGSQLWGGADYVQDIMVGGNGTDIFIGGRTQGADVFFNASSADIVHLNDATLSDIVATEENNGAIAIAFNTGNVVGVQSSELLSAAVMLADGSAYRYNHATKNWQSA